MPALELVAPRLPRWSPQEASSARFLFDGRLHQHLANLLPGTQLQRLSQVTDRSDHLELVCANAGVEVIVSFPVRLAPMLASMLHSKAWSMAMRARCAVALANARFEPLVAWMRACDLELVALRPADMGQNSATDAIRTTARFHFDGFHGLVSVRSEDPDWLDRVIAKLDHAVPQAGTSVDSLPVEARFAFGRRRIAATLLAGLAPGDVVLLGDRVVADALDIVSPDPDPDPDAAVPPIGTTGCLRIGRRGKSRAGLACRWHTQHLMITGDQWMDDLTPAATATSRMAIEPSSASATTGMDRPPGGGHASQVADIELTLHMELQAISLTIGALQALRAGAVIELTQDAEDARLDLVVGGQVFGRAQLVRIGDRLGARILELGHEPG